MHRLFLNRSVQIRPKSGRDLVQGIFKQALNYSLTLHGADGERLVGFDNAHPVRAIRGPGSKRRQEYDHKHRLRTVRPYEYQDAAALIVAFWAEVDAVLKEKGVLP